MDRYIYKKLIWNGTEFSLANDSYASADIDVCQKCGFLSHFLCFGSVLGIFLCYLLQSDVTVFTFTHINIKHVMFAKGTCKQKNGMRRSDSDQLFATLTLFYLYWLEITKCASPANEKKTKQKM